MQIERAYYHHADCHRGWVPLDERLDLGASSELSPRVQEMVSYLGGFMPFDQAQTFLDKYCTIQISHDTVNNATVAIGQALGGKQETGVRIAWEEDHLPTCEVATPPQRLYVSADRINHLLPDGQGKEIKVAAVNETEERQNKDGEIEVHAIHIEYVVHSDAEELARAAYLIARKRGVEQAEQIIVLGDGAKWIWNRIAFMFPRQKTTEILDFYHASEYIWDAGKITFGPATPKTQEWGSNSRSLGNWARVCSLRANLGRKRVEISQVFAVKAVVFGEQASQNKRRAIAVRQTEKRMTARILRMCHE